MSTSITVAVKRRLPLKKTLYRPPYAHIAFCLLLTACGGCTKAATLPSTFEPAILRDSLPNDKAGVTLCAENNVPFIVLNHRWRGTDLDVGFRVHEEDHAAQAHAAPGGCKAFLRRYTIDLAFRAQVELSAYCAQGRWMVAHGHDPVEVWAYIANAMREWHGMEHPKNCLYEGGS